MFAVIKTGGKQYKVEEGDVLYVEKLNEEKGNKVTLDKVLLIGDEGNTLIGTPFVKNALVKVEVIENFKDKKVIVFKKKRRKQYKKKRGHRQELTRIKIEEIVSGVKAAPKKKPVEVAKKEKEKVVPKKIPVEVAKKEKAAPEKRVEVSKTKTEDIEKGKPKKVAKPLKVKKESKPKEKVKVLKVKKSKAEAHGKKKTTAKTAAKAKKPTKIKEK